MTRDPDPIDFDDVVASWRAEGGVPQWPRDDGSDDDRGRRTDVDERTPRPRADEDSAVHRERGVPDEPSAGPDRDGPPEAARTRSPHDPDAVPAAPDAPGAPDAADPLDDEHFVPPEPPPVPRMGPPMLVGLTLIGLGLVLVTFPGWVGVPQVYGLPLGLVGIAAGLGWLVLRLWPDSADDGEPPRYLDDPDDPDGGAVL